MCANMDFIGTGINHGGLAMNGVFPRQHFYGQHGEDGLQIAFTSGNDPFVVQHGKGKTAVVPVRSISLKQLTVTALSFSSLQIRLMAR